MTKEEIFNYFYTNSANLGVKSITIIMLAALLIGFIIHTTYKVTYKGVAYNNRFSTSLMVILLISTVIMLMISSNIVISLGMVGALSIVRFRTAIKDSKDTIFIFWAITEGLCVGSQNFELALVTTLFITLVIVGINFIPNKTNKYLLVIMGGKSSIDYDQIEKTIKPFIISSKNRTMAKDDNHQEFIIEIKTKGELDSKIIDKLLENKKITSVNFVVESGDTIG